MIKIELQKSLEIILFPDLFDLSTCGITLDERTSIPCYVKITKSVFNVMSSSNILSVGCFFVYDPNWILLIDLDKSKIGKAKVWKKILLMNCLTSLMDPQTLEITELKMDYLDVINIQEDVIYEDFSLFNSLNRRVIAWNGILTFQTSNILKDVQNHIHSAKDIYIKKHKDTLMKLLST